MSGMVSEKADNAISAAPAADMIEEEKKEEAVPVSAIAMKLLDMRLKPSTAILASSIGEYTREKAQEVVVAKTSGVLELYEIHAAEDGSVSLKLLQRLETHSILRGLANVRLTGEKRDLIAVTSDAGSLSIVDFKQTSTPNVVVFGKTGCRRATPGQYIAADPKGRAVMVSAVEKRKLVYVLNHATGKTTIASPLEAHRSRNIIFDTCGVDNGYENPIFACIELQYPEDDADTPNANKQLAYYELDLGLNHVSRKWATNVHSTSCCIAALPGGQDGPGGVIIGMEDGISYHHPDLSSPVICGIPRRALDSTKRGILVTKLTVHRQKKSKFFCLLQSEVGDVYKLSVDVSEDKKVTGMEVALLDTLPTANSMNISKRGMLFVASEFGDHGLYQFERIDLPDAPTNNSGEVSLKNIADWNTELAVKTAKTFTPTMLKNLRRVHALDNPTPTTGVLVGELAGHEVSPQIYTLAGRGPTASLRVLRHGASVTELAVSELPGIPGGIFTIPHDEGEDQGLSKYIVVSFADATLVLSVGDTVEEVGQESRFKTDAPTLACSTLKGNGGLCQIYPDGLRQIKAGQLRNWECPGLKRVESASANAGQALLALAGGEVIYFELDNLTGDLNEMVTRDMGADVCCLDVGMIPSGKSRSLFAAVGCRDQTVKIVSLEPGKYLTQKSSTALKSRPHSVKIQYPENEQDYIVLMIGLDDGSSLRATVDPVTGAIGASPTRRFLGARPVSVSRVPLEGQSAMLLLSSRPWISRVDAASGKHVMAPLSYAPLDHGCVFSSHAVKEGIVATAGKTLRIISVDTSGMEGGEDEAFNSNRISLRYTPRQMTLLSASAAGDQQRKVVLAVVEADYNDFGLDAKKSLGFDATAGADSKKKGAKKGDDDAMDVDSDDEEAAAEAKKEEEEEEESEDEDEKAARTTPIRGPLPPEPGHWGSCIRLMDPSDSCRTLDCVELSRNEAALCCTSVRFHTRGGESLLAVGTVTGMTMNPLTQTSSHVALYRVVNGDRLQLLHRTTIDDGPVLALAHFQGRLLVGIGKTLRLYEMGKRQLLRKCELRGLPTFVKTLQTAGDRAYFGDMMRSLHIIRYEPSANRLVLVASDPSPRPIVSQELLDWNTIAVGDKFGNICIMRLPRGADMATIDVTGQRALWDSSRDNKTPKLEILCQYYVGEIVTSMTRSSLVAGGSESLIYVTATGRIGALVPFTSRDDVEFFTQLEGHLRSDAPRPTGRDPQAYRSYYAPVMQVVDGDLCSVFNGLPHEKQSEIAERLDRTVGEVMKKLEDTRNALL